MLVGYILMPFTTINYFVATKRISLLNTHQLHLHYGYAFASKNLIMKSQPPENSKIVEVMVSKVL
mgnify:FL=1